MELFFTLLSVLLVLAVIIVLWPLWLILTVLFYALSYSAGYSIQETTYNSVCYITADSKIERDQCWVKERT